MILPIIITAILGITLILASVSYGGGLYFLMLLVILLFIQVVVYFCWIKAVLIQI
jgi:hypothetical protein